MSEERNPVLNGKFSRSRRKEQSAMAVEGVPPKMLSCLNRIFLLCVAIVYLVSLYYNVKFMKMSFLKP